jgi:hypothetical protein
VLALSVSLVDNASSTVSELASANIDAVSESALASNADLESVGGAASELKPTPADNSMTLAVPVGRLDSEQSQPERRLAARPSARAVHSSAVV